MKNAVFSRRLNIFPETSLFFPDARQERHGAEGREEEAGSRGQGFKVKPMRQTWPGKSSPFSGERRCATLG
jgi:hypothetical protein